MKRSWIGLGLFAVLGACASTGRLPMSVVDMYDRAKADGWMEIEAERDGTIIEIEADIEVSQVPAPVMEAARKQLPGGRVTGAEYELVGGKASYEVKMNQGGRDYEFVFTPEGELVESEKELMRNEAPKGVVEAALAAVPGSAFKSVEVIEMEGKTLYHVKTTKGGATYKVVLSAEGKITRKVREAKAEIEIPLK